MNQYPAPMPGHFMWHLFSIPLWAQRAGWVPPHHRQSLSASTEVCNLHWASSHLSLTERAFVFRFQEFGSLTGARRVGGKKQLFAAVLRKSCKALFNQLLHPVVKLHGHLLPSFICLSKRLSSSYLAPIWFSSTLLSSLLDIAVPEGLIKKLQINKNKKKYYEGRKKWSLHK